MKRALVPAIALLACSGAGTACTKDPEVVARSVIVYSLRSCPVAESQAYSVIYAGGDFEPSAAHPPTSSQFLRDVGRTMSSLPVETRSIIVDVSERDLGWRGITDVASAGPTNVLVWRGSEACRLTRDVERRQDTTFGVFGRHFIVVGGRAFDGSSVPHTFVGDLSTGAIERLELGLRTRRVRPTVTAFQSPLERAGGPAGQPLKALVAGGSDPDSDVPLASAEVYAPNVGAPSDVGDFEDQRIDLSEPRAQHGAVVLSSGETLLVGGRGLAGPLRTLEIVDPVTRRARTSGVALLRVARIAPTVVRLANGEVLVAGGVDAQGAKIATLEWLSPDATRATKRPVDLVTGQERAFVPLEAGGALAVIMPEAPAAPDFKTVWIISADGTLEAGTPIDPLTLSRVRLFPGAEGAPIVWTGARWLRWSPWTGAFTAFADAPTTGPTLDAIGVGDTGLALWLQDRDTAGFNVMGFRFAARTRYGALPNPLLVIGPDATAPDRLASESSLSFDAERGLLLGPGASAFVTDVSFADFDLSVDVTANAPVLVLRDEHGVELEVGGAGCAFAQSATRAIAITRRAARVDVSVDGAAARACPTEVDPSARISVGVRGPQLPGVSGAKTLRIVRR